MAIELLPRKSLTNYRSSLTTTLVDHFDSLNPRWFSPCLQYVASDLGSNVCSPQSGIVRKPRCRVSESLAPALAGMRRKFCTHDTPLVAVERRVCARRP